MRIKINSITLADCLKGMGEIKNQNIKIDAIVTSPPYNIGKKYSKYDDKVERKKYLEWMLDISNKIYDVMDNETSFFLNIGSIPKDQWISYDVANIFRKKLKLQNTIHWIKAISIKENGNKDFISVGHYKPINSNRFVNNMHEYIFHFTKDNNVKLDRLSIGVPFKHKSNITRWKTNKKDIRCRGNTWFIPYKTIQQSKLHPAYFPIELPEMCIKLHGLEKTNLVLDPFMGSGSTAIACKKLNIDFIGFEIDEKYIEEAERRLKET